MPLSPKNFKNEIVEYTMQYYVAMEKVKPCRFQQFGWMEGIVLSDISHKEGKH